jgi:hypothetical protein
VYEVDDDPARVDVDTAWEFLSTEAYWARWRTRGVVEQQIRTAWRVVGAYESPSGKQAGFARAVSDGLAIAIWRTHSSCRRTGATRSERGWCGQ